MRIYASAKKKKSTNIAGIFLSPREHHSAGDAHPEEGALGAGLLEVLAADEDDLIGVQRRVDRRLRVVVHMKPHENREHLAAGGNGSVDRAKFLFPYEGPRKK